MSPKAHDEEGRGPGVRQRLLANAIALMRQRGVDGFGMAELLDKSGAARGSVYQYFPQGKRQLLAAATAQAAAEMTAKIGLLLEERPPGEAVAVLVDWWKRLLVKTDFAYGCPVAAASVGAQSFPEAGRAAAEGFGASSRLFADALRERGFGHEQAVALGSVLTSAIEGAIIQARSLRSTQPLDLVADYFRTVLPGSEG